LKTAFGSPENLVSTPRVLGRTVARKFSKGGLCSSAGGLFVCAGGLAITKLTKTPLIYSVSRFNLGGLGVLFGGLSPPKPPVAKELVLGPPVENRWFRAVVLNHCWFDSRVRPPSILCAALSSLSIKPLIFCVADFVSFCFKSKYVN